MNSTIRLGFYGCCLATICTATAAAEDRHAALRARIDSTAVLLAPATPPAPNPGLDPAASMLVIADSEGSELSGVTETAETLVARAGFKLIHIDRRRGRVSVSDDRAYDLTQSSLAATDDVEIARNAQALISRMGVPEGDAVRHVRHLGASDKDTMEGVASTAKADAATVRRIATKVFFHRRIGGIPVVGDRLVMSYALDGSLRKILGSWHPLEYAKARLTLQMSFAAFEAKALDELNDMLTTTNLRIVDGTPIKLSTAYVVREYEPGHFTVDLHGLMTYRVHGPDGGSKVTEHVLGL